MNGLKRTLLLLFIIFPAICIAQSPPPIYNIVSDDFTALEIDSTYWQVLEDKEASFRITQVNSQPLSAQFQSAAKRTATDSVYTIWMRCRLKNSMSTEAHVSMESKAGKTDFHIVRADGSINHFNTGRNLPYTRKDGFKNWEIIPFSLHPGETVFVYMRKQNTVKFTVPPHYKIPLFGTAQLSEKAIKEYQDGYIETPLMYLSFFSGLLLLAGIFNFLLYMQTKDKVSLYFSLFLVFISIAYHPHFTHIIPRENKQLGESIDYFSSFSLVFLLYFIRHYFHLFVTYPRYDKFVLIVTALVSFIKIACIFFSPDPTDWLYELHDLSARTFSIISVVTFIIASLIALKNRTEQSRVFLLAVLPLIIFILISILLAVFVLTDAQLIRIYNTNMYLGGLFVIWAAIVFSKHLFKQYAQQQKQLLQIELERKKEQADFMAKQKVELEKQVAERTNELKTSLQKLQDTQKQLIQSEKMASLGELTAGIAHEIQNPLNFVNNFSEINAELITELNGEIKEGNQTEALSIAENMNQNLQKIIYHGKRADAIVKSMLQHSQTSKGKKELTDINALVDEYLRLSYHGLRAKDKNFNANFTTNLDDGIEKINVAPQEIGRVLLNLYNNAFYSVNEKKKRLDGAFSPNITVSTKKDGSSIKILIQDNGTGIPQEAIDKIFQPFFTTKPTGQGTGLGLSLSYDIIKAHGGEIKVETKEGEGSEFVIHLPV